METDVIAWNAQREGADHIRFLAEVTVLVAFVLISLQPQSLAPVRSISLYLPHRAVHSPQVFLHQQRVLDYLLALLFDLNYVEVLVNLDQWLVHRVVQ